MLNLRHLTIAAGAALLTALIAGAPGVSFAGPFETDRVIVQFVEEVTMGDIDALLGGFGAAGERALTDSTTFLVRIPHDWTVGTAVQVFNQIPVVAYAGFNYFCPLVETSQMSQAILDGASEPFSLGVTPDDYYAQFTVTTTSMANGQQMATGGGQIIGLIDNGVDFQHPLLSAGLLPGGFDFVDDDPDPSYEDGDFAGHGTFSAGLLLLAAPDAGILAIRSIDGDGWGTIFTVVLGVDHAIAGGAHVLCLGFGLAVDDPFLSAAIQRAEEAGITVVAPAGNDNQNSPVHYPAGYRTVLGVGAVDMADIRAVFSNYGTWIDLVAPGKSVYSSLPGGDFWGRWDGTSFSAPFVAGLAALVQELHPSAPPCVVRSIIVWGCDDIDALNPLYAGELGAGRINFAKSAGHDHPVVSLRGWTTDSASAALAGVEFLPFAAGNPLHKSHTLADESGFYVTALPAGTYDLVYSLPAESGFATKTLSLVAIAADTVVSVVMAPTPTAPCVAPGDYDGDGFATGIDLGILVDHLFAGGSLADAPECHSGVFGDADCDGFITALDLSILIDYLFAAGTAPRDGC